MECQRQCWKCRGYKEYVYKANIKHCRVCNGLGQITTTIRKSKQRKPYRPFKQVINRGSDPKYNFYDPAMKPGVNEILCGLVGRWGIYQHETGHRVTTDDYCCAAVAVRELLNSGRNLETHLDLGTGLGTILNIVKWKFYSSLKFSLGVEAQVENHRLALKTCEFNFGNRDCKVVNSDLRNLDIQILAQFQLITGTPPYFRNNTGSYPVDNGRQQCAFETRGGIQDYCYVASRSLQNSHSRFVVANSSLEIKRTEAFANECGMKLIKRVDFCGISGKQPLFSVFMFQLDDGLINQCEIEQIDIRDSDGTYAQEYIDLTVPIGLPETRY